METTQLILPNGLKATIHPARSKIVKQLLKRCLNRNEIFIKPCSLFALEVEVENEHVYFLYWIAFNNPQQLTANMQRNFESTLQLNAFTIYNNIAYSFLSQTHDALVSGVIQKIKPHIAVLIADQGGKISEHSNNPA